MFSGIELAEQGWLPDFLLRLGIRRLLAARLRLEKQQGPAERIELHRQFVAQLKQSPIAINTQNANEQHYEVPAAYFDLVLGPHRKYSSCLWPAGVNDLASAEEAMLSLTCEHAGLKDGMEILELGCGWGSLALWMAQRFPASRILAISNSKSQREFILSQAGTRHLTNLEVQTEDINQFETDRVFDRIVSVEMLEHLRNYEQLFSRISGWLRPEAKFFAHVFYHGRCAYPFETDGKNDWMARHFFTGGVMPSADLFLEFQNDLQVEERWYYSGVHYQKTLESWLVRHDANRDQIMALFEPTYGRKLANVMFHRWRIFYVACAELFGYCGGEEWGVAHFLFHRRF